MRGGPPGLVCPFPDGKHFPPSRPGMVYFMDIVVEVEVPSELWVSFEILLYVI